MATRPTLLSSCARAATATEARFRIDAPIAPARAPRVIALDEPSARVVRRVAEQPWATARFFTCEDPPHMGDRSGELGDGLRLRSTDDVVSLLGEQLTEADVVVMAASTDEGAAAASAVGMACSLRGILTAGLVLSDATEVSQALTALRPHARVLMVPADEDDLFQLLTALRA